MRKIHFSRAALLHCLLLFSASFGAADDIKNIHPTGYVSDLAGVISPKAQSQLEALCAEVEQKTGAQMAIVTIPSLESESVENYAVDLFKQLAVGSKTIAACYCWSLPMSTSIALKWATGSSR